MGYDYKAIIKNLPDYIRKYRGFWRIYLLKIGLLEEPIRIGKRGRRPEVYLRKSDFPTFDEFYFYDGYKDIDIEGYDVFVDIGAHVGLFSIRAAEKTDDVMAYEPDKNTYELLKRNIKLNDIENCKTYNYGVDKEKGEKEIQITDNSAANSIEIERKEQKETEKIKTTTLEEVASKINQKDEVFLKLDCEGSEFPILKNTSQETLRKFDKIFLEYHAEAGKPEELKKILENSGFNVTEREDPRDKEFENLGFYVANLL